MNAKKLAKRIAALSMAAAMVFSVSPVATFANEVQSVGESNGHVAMKKTLVTLPTIEAEDVAFIADPEGLIEKTRQTKDNKIVTGNSAGVYFTGNDCKTSSAAFAALNIGTEDVVVSVTVKADTVEKAMALTHATADFSGPADLEKNAELNMNLVLSNAAATATATRAITDGGAIITESTAQFTLTGNAANYDVLTNAAGYIFDVKDGISVTDAAAGWDSNAFYLEGNTVKGSAKDLNAPSFTITWDFTGPDNEDGSSKVADKNGVPLPTDVEPTVNGKTASDPKQTIHYTSGQDLVIPASIGSGNLAAASLDRITYVNSSGVSTKLDAQFVTLANDKITIKESYITSMANNNVTRDYKVTFVDSEGATYKQITIQLAP